MGLTTMGSQTRTILLHTENHKTTCEFVVAAAVKKGGMVKLTADGKVTPWLATDNEWDCIGVAYGDAEVDAFVTIWTRGYSIIHATVLGAMSAGPATFTTMRAAGAMEGYPEWAAASTQAKCLGWALEEATAADQLIRILAKD